MENNRSTKVRLLHLFRLKNGGVSTFKISPDGAYARELRGIIEMCGGRTLYPGEHDPFVIPLIVEDALNTSNGVAPSDFYGNIPKDSFRSRFIVDCYKWAEVVDLNRYRIGDSKYPEYDANVVLKRGISWKEMHAKLVNSPKLTSEASEKEVISEMYSDIAAVVEDMIKDPHWPATEETVSNASPNIHTTPTKIFTVLPQIKMKTTKKTFLQRKLQYKNKLFSPTYSAPEAQRTDSGESAPVVPKIKRKGKTTEDDRNGARPPKISKSQNSSVTIKKKKTVSSISKATAEVDPSFSLPPSFHTGCVPLKKKHMQKKEHSHQEDATVQSVVGDDRVEEIKKEKKKKIKHASVDDSHLRSPFESSVETPSDIQPSCSDPGSPQNRVEDKEETGKYTCDMCSFKTEVAYELVYHLREHTGTGSRYRCHYCMFRAEIKKELKAHRKQHKSGSTYKCLKCVYSTGTKSALKSHYTSIHHGGKNYTCELCDFKSSTAYHMRIHRMKQHKSENN